jgi:hypothetical protein
MDMMGKECIARHFEPTLSHRTPDGTTVVIRHRVVDDWTRMRNERMIVKDGTARSWEVGHAIYSGGELRTMLGQAGFVSVSLFGDLDGNPTGSAPAGWSRSLSRRRAGRPRVLSDAVRTAGPDRRAACPWACEMILSGDRAGIWLRSSGESGTP